jgi:hypothetical protein
MSFMPNVGTVVRLKDERIAAVSSFSPLGDDDKVIFEDGHEEPTDAWQITEMLTEEDDAHLAPPLEQLRRYLRLLPDQLQEQARRAPVAPKPPVPGSLDIDALKSLFGADNWQSVQVQAKANPMLFAALHIINGLLFDRQQARNALGRIEGWSRHFNADSHTMQRGTMELIHDEAQASLTRPPAAVPDEHLLERGL